MTTWMSNGEYTYSPNSLKDEKKKRLKKLIGREEIEEKSRPTIHEIWNNLPKYLSNASKAIVKFFKNCYYKGKHLFILACRKAKSWYEKFQEFKEKHPVFKKIWNVIRDNIFKKGISWFCNKIGIIDIGASKSFFDQSTGVMLC